jgi:hypothetical protein
MQEFSLKGKNKQYAIFRTREKQIDDDNCEEQFTDNNVNDV